MLVYGVARTIFEKKNHPKLKLGGLQLNSFSVNIKLSTLEI